MAIAGKVAITLSTENGGVWSADVTYDRLVAVRRNNNLYISRKVVTNVEPPNDEFWFLTLEGYRGDDVQALIDSMNAVISGVTQVGNAKTLDGHGTSYFATDSDLIVERERISNLARLNEGSTTGDAELVDARVGADGKTYDNVGDAVRGQITDLKSDLFDSNLSIKPTLTMNDGFYINADGGIGTHTNFTYSEPFEVKKGCTLLLKASGHTGNVSMISIKNGSSYTPLKICSSEDVIDYSYTFENDNENVVVCYDKTKDHSIKIYNDIELIKSNIGNLTELSAENTENIDLLSRMTGDGSFSMNGNVGSNYIPYEWIVGHTYRVTNTSSDQSVNIAMYTSDGTYTGDIETFTNNLPYGESVELTITTEANNTRLYCTGDNGSVSVLDKGQRILSDNKYNVIPLNKYENFSVEVDYGGSAKYTDYGVIALPNSYDRKGKPTKLIIFCQGTGERTDATTYPLNNWGWEYFLAKGYAVMDMNGMAPAWGEAKGFPITNQHFCNKYLLSSYAKGYEYVMEHYNLDKRVYVMGISMGGGASALIVQSKILPVVAHACFCPALSVYKQDYMNPWMGENQQKTIAGQWGFYNWKNVTPSQDYFLEQMRYYDVYDNLLINTIGDKSIANANYGNEAEANAYNSMYKIYPVPLKIWHCADDTTVLYRYSQFMVNMIKNAGGIADLTTYETGGHLGGWTHGEVVDAGVTTSEPFYEAIRFFNSFI